MPITADWLDGLDAAGDVHPRPFDACYWLVAGRLLAGEHPGTLHLSALWAGGFSRYVDLTSPSDPVQPYEPLRLAGKVVQRESHPILDFGVPTIEAMRAVLDSILASLAQGERIYLHCRAGIGRTGTVAGCLLVDLGLSGEQALRLLQFKWQVTQQYRTEPHTPETHAQRAFVRAWEQHRQGP
ncbi:MAG: protein-tyrosine phosphatase family protein [Rubrivivax sp.]